MKTNTLRQWLLIAAVVATALPTMAQRRIKSLKPLKDTPMLTYISDYSKTSVDSMVTASIHLECVRTSNKMLSDSINKFFAGVFASENNNPLDSASAASVYTGPLDPVEMQNWYGERYYKSLDSTYRTMDLAKDGIGFSHQLNIEKIADAPKYVTFLVTTYWYLGGAHGNGLSYGATFNKEDGHRLHYKLDPAQLDSMQTFFRQGLAKYFTQGGDSVNDSTVYTRLLLEDETNRIIPYPQYEPYLTPDGWKFTYQQYEISSYAAGRPEFTLPKPPTPARAPQPMTGKKKKKKHKKERIIWRMG